jgi:hypothetical protein
MIKTVTAVRYITPLREGGSLPALVEANDGLLYVMKFVGAGHGTKALIAELVAGEIARRLGLRVPEIVFILLEASLGRSEPNAEIRDLLQTSVGLNLGLRYLPSALMFNPLLQPSVESDLASAIVWFDAYVTNVDRTPRNVNMLIWQNELWLIDHGSALYFHHDWGDYMARSLTPFAFIRQHTLIHSAAALHAADSRSRALLSPDVLRNVVVLIPDHWLGDEPRFASRAQHREAYLEYLYNRLNASHLFVEEAMNAYSRLV